MNMNKRKGQVLTISALFIALLILSTQTYMLRLNRTEISSNHEEIGDFILGINQGTQHVITASLINITKGGVTSVLRNNLNRWEVFLSKDYRYGFLILNSTLTEKEPYSNGLNIDWGLNGVGVSSAASNFTLYLEGKGVEVDLSYSINVTTKLHLIGNYIDKGNDIKTVVLNVSLFNDGKPALIGSFYLNYFNSSQWYDSTLLPDYNEMDFGNGSYRYVFTVQIPGNQVQIRMQIFDRRGVFVETQSTILER